MLEAGGYSLVDLGRGVPNEKFIEAAVHEHAEVVALSAMMTTTMAAMPEIIKGVKKNAKYYHNSRRFAIA